MVPHLPLINLYPLTEFWVSHRQHLGHGEGRVLRMHYNEGAYSPRHPEGGEDINGLEPVADWRAGYDWMGCVSVYEA